MNMRRVLAAWFFLFTSLLPGLSCAAVKIIDLHGGDGSVFQRDKAVATEKTQQNNLSLEGNFGYQSFNNNTQVQITAERVVNRRSGGTSGSLRLELWALAAPYNGGSWSGYKMGQGSLNPLPAGFQYTNVSLTSSYSRPSQPGTYYVVLMLTEFSSSISQNNGYGSVDWGNFSNTLVIGGGSGGGSLTIPGAWSWQISGGNLHVTAERIVNGRSGGSSGTLRLELWALANPYAGATSFSGYKIGQQQYSPLPAGMQYTNIDFTTSALLPPNGTWNVVLMLTEYSSSITTNNGFGVVDYRNSNSPLVVGTTPPPTTGGVLANGVPVGGINGALNSSVTFTATVPAGARNLQFRTSGGSGDPDLYVRFGAPVSGSSYDCGSASTSSTESCLFPTPSAGTWHVLIHGYTAYSGLTLTASWETPTPPPTTGGVLANGVPVGGINGALNSSVTFTATVPAGARNLQFRTSGGSGDPDLYVRFGAPVSGSSYDCGSASTSSTESCLFPTPSAGTWHVLIHGYTAYSGLTLTASWETANPGVTVDEPGFSNFSLPLPNPPFPSCPGGYFVAAVDDGAGPGLTRGIFGLELLLNQPGTQRLEGGLNFGGLLDGSQPAFAGFNFNNPANEPQRLDLVLTGNPRSSQYGVLPVLIRLIRQPAPGINETVLETTANLTLAQQFIRSIDLMPAFYVVTVAPIGSAYQPGGNADGEVYVSLATRFVNRPGGGFSAGVVVGGYHDVHPFAGVSGFGAFCLGSGHSASAQVFSAPTYGASGARDLRLRVLDNLSGLVIQRP
ncbi:MAG: hypothetical protein AMXMBFR25_01240 [Lysobacterales bacterium]|nr:hypothetical protein [Xanthomonadales bacterium]